MAELLATVRRGSALLFRAGAAHFALAGLALALMPFDARVVTGLDPWVKPFKFMASIGLYLWTVAWLLAPLEAPRAKRWIERGVALAMGGETALLWTQAARGVRSHFNADTPFDAAVFAVMGALILANTLLVAWLFALYLRRPLALPPLARAGARAGMALFLVGSAVGAALVRNGAHTVGAPDGGPGLPLLDWSTRAGDLRVAHALGLHALTALPLFGLWLGGRSRWSGGARRGALGLAAAALLALILATLAQALGGRPFLPLSS